MSEDRSDITKISEDYSEDSDLESQEYLQDPLENKECFEDRSGKCPSYEITQNKNVTLRHIHHYLVPGLNIHTESTNYISDDFKIKETPLVSSPWPIYISVEEPDVIDLCHRRVLALDEYKFKLKRCQSFYHKSKKRKEYKKAIKKRVYPYTVIKFAELLEKHPDPYFNSKYDLYYTGGNLCPIENENLIFHTTGHNLNNLVLSKLVSINGKSQLDPIQSITLESPNSRTSEIFEIQVINTQIDCIVRQKHSISHYTYGGDELRSSYTIENPEIPFISYAKGLNSTNLITSDMTKTVLLWDLNNSSKTPNKTLYKSTTRDKKDNWNRLQHLEAFTYAFTDLKKFKIFDIRSPFEDIKYSSFMKFCEPCEEISALVNSENNKNLLYFGTTHKIFAVDIRYFKGEYLSRWVHQMYSPPLILKTYEDNRNDLILLGNSHSGDIRICKNVFDLGDDNKKRMKASSIPFMPPSTLDAYNENRLKGICLDISRNVRRRIQSCNTGLSFLKIDQENYILKANSIGDVFIHKLHTDDCFSDSFNNYIIEEWMNYENMLSSRNGNKSLNVTCVDDLSSLKKVFQCKRLNEPETKKDHVNEKEEPERPRRLRKWQRKIGDLQKYEDALAKDLLSIWEIDFEENDLDVGLEKIKMIAEKQPDTDKIVSDWLDSGKLPLEDKTPETLLKLNESNVSNPKKQLNETSLDTTMFRTESLDLDNSKVTTERIKHKTKKRKHVIGL